MNDDPFSLERFVSAQDSVLDEVTAELRAGRKRTHWMWFVFPQIQGLGSSEMAQTYAITSLDEARAYLRHPVLGDRLLALSQIVADVQGRSAIQIFGPTDEMKFHACLTLFTKADQTQLVFGTCLNKYFAGKLHTATLALIRNP